MEIRQKKTNQIITITYEKWVLNIVNFGNAHEYDVITYPDIIDVVFIQPSGTRIKHATLDRKQAMDMIRQYPRQFDYEEIDVKSQILKDIAKSNTIGTKINKHKLITVTKKILYFLTFILLIPLFSSKARITAKKFIDNNINVIQTIVAVIMFILALYSIYLVGKN